MIRRFVSLARTIHTDNDCFHTLDAIDNEGRAWWMILDLEDMDYKPEWSELTPLPTRKEQP